MQGFSMVAQEFNNILVAEGLRPIEAKGKLFDPYMHEVVTCVANDDCPDNTVLEEVQKGYLFGSHAIRYAKVIVSKQTQKQQTQEGGV